MIFSNTNKTALFIKEKNKSGKEVDKKISSYFEVTRIIDQLPFNSEERRFEILTRNDNFENTFSVKLKDSSNIKELLSVCNANFLMIENKYEGLVWAEINRQKNEAISKGKIEYEHNFTGWFNFNNKEMFFYDKVDIPGVIKSTCVRPHGNFVSGSEQEYDDMLIKHVYKKDMCLPYVMGFSGVLVSRIPSANIGVMVLGLTGSSTTGKTTALKLMGSIWGDINTQSTSIILKNNCTDIALLGQASGIYGAPNMLYDDLFVNDEIRKRKFFMQLENGGPRVGCKTNGKPDFSRLGCSGCVVITDENPLLDGVSKHGGLVARVIDFNEYKWTKSSVHSDAIMKIISKNYGFKGKRFAEYIEKISVAQLEEMLNEHYKKLKKSIKCSKEFKDRRAKSYAVIMLTVELLNKCFGQNINERKILKMLKANESVAAQDRALLAYQNIINYFFNNKRYFDVHEHGEVVEAKFGRKGIAKIKNNKLDLYVSDNDIDDILKTGKYTQLNNYKKDWRDRLHVLQAEKDRYLSDYGTLGSCYHFVHNIKKED